MTSAMAMTDQWQVPQALEKYWRLRLGPTDGKTLVIGGDLEFRTIVQQEEIEETFEIEIRIPHGFPNYIPSVFETGGRIPGDFHKLTNGSLCLGTPTDILGRLQDNPTLLNLIEQIIVPYLAGFIWHSKHGTMPFGEQVHGMDGLLQHFCELFNTKDVRVAVQFVFLASLRVRFANRFLCPCGKRRRLGRCHNFLVNGVRKRHGRKWFQRQYLALTMVNHS